VLHIIADAEYLGYSAFAPRYAELRCFAGKDFQTEEKIVKSLAAALARACAELSHDRAAASRPQFSWAIVFSVG
jgi:hypothetical protein